MSESGQRSRPGTRKTEVSQRLEEAARLHLAGHAPGTVVNRLAAKFAMSQRNARRYLRRVKHLIAHESKRANGADGQRQLRDDMRSLLRRMMAEAIDDDDRAGALKVAERLCRLDALDKPTTERVEVTHDIGAHTDDDVLGRVLETELALVRKRAAA